MYPVKVYDKHGKLVRTIGVKKLNEMGDQRLGKGFKFRMPCYVKPPTFKEDMPNAKPKRKT